VNPEHLNDDDTLGKALDALHAFGLTKLYRLIARRAAERLGLGSTVAMGHLETPPVSTWTGATTANATISTKTPGSST
jgi:hypothetical protein